MRSEITAFTLSVIMNAAVMGALDHTIQHYDQSLAHDQMSIAARQKMGKIRFEFVESPAQTSSLKPKNPDKISDRDSVAQDLDKIDAETGLLARPKIDVVGNADQLAQVRGGPSQAPAVLSKPSAQVTPSAAESKNEALKKEEKKIEPGSQQETIEPSKAISQMTNASKPESKAAPASLPQKPIQGLAGQDRITTQAVSRTKSHGVQLYGTTSFEATGSGMGQYMKNLKERIWLVWFPYLSFHYPKDFQTADAVIEFTLDKTGQVKSVQTLASEGSSLFATFCVEAVQRASPFGPLPQEILDLVGKDDLEVKFAFHYW